VSSITQSSGTATVTTATSHGLATGDTVLIAGATEVDYNGEFLITFVSSTSFTYIVANSPTSPATGTITSKRAPAGFTKIYTATGKGVYRTNNLTGSRPYVRIVDNAATTQREGLLTCYMSMSDIDTGTDIFPTAAQYASGFIIMKSDALNTSARNWLIITDGKTVYGFTYFNGAAIESPGLYKNAFAFGEYLSYKPGDAYSAFCTGSSISGQSSTTQYCGLFNSANSVTAGTPGTTTPLLATARDYSGISGSKIAQVFASGLSTSLGFTSYVNFPNAPDNGFYMVPAFLTQANIIRGRLPGFFEGMHGPALPNATLIENIVGYTGRRFLFMRGQTGSGECSCVIDITGPWDT
jgi:hypothetical protein